MKKISQFKIGEVVCFADADYEIIKHHISGCTVRPVKPIEHRIRDKVVTYRPNAYQVSNWTEITEKEIEGIRLQDYLTELFNSVADSKELFQAHITMLENKGGL